MTYWAMQRTGERTASIDLYAPIGESLFGDATSARQFAAELKGLGEVDALQVNINSPGGSVFEGLAIYNILRNHPARVTTHVVGLAASIASVVAMAGDEVRMAGNAMMMIHDPWAVAMGDAGELRRQADILDKTKGALVYAYARKSGMPVGDIESLMADETWLSAEEAVAFKLADVADAPLALAALLDDPRRIVRNFINPQPQEGTMPNPLMQAQPVTAPAPEPLTIERLRAEHGALIAEIERAARAAERERIQGVEALELPGLGTLVAELKYREDVKPENAAMVILAAEKARREQVMRDRQADAPAPVAVTPEPVMGHEDRSRWPLDKRAEWDWTHDPIIRAEFGSQESYMAYLQAEARGAFRILQK